MGGGSRWEKEARWEMAGEQSSYAVAAATTTATRSSTTTPVLLTGSRHRRRGDMAAAGREQDIKIGENGRTPQWSSSISKIMNGNDARMRRPLQIGPQLLPMQCAGEHIHSLFKPTGGGAPLLYTC
uniref:Uncharacterized protein n=1 Tax=Oryza nivara TaxID=4536 RepID=A0A0E0HDG6_ORYNI